MKTLFIEAKKKNFEEVGEISVPYAKIGLFYTIQFKNLFDKIKLKLEKEGKKAVIGKGILQDGQILGCNVESALSIEKKVDCFLLISSGRWHALSLSLFTDKPVYIMSEGRTSLVSKEEIDSLKKRRKGAISKFLLSDKIGIIASTKPGQNKLKEALIIKKELEKKGKKAFLFISETINLKELENFKIDSWINTACPGLIFDFPGMINLSEYKQL